MVCKVTWCVMTAASESPYCAIHRDHPPLHSWETMKDWSMRTSRERAAAKRAAERAAESDAVLQSRKGRVQPKRT